MVLTWFFKSINSKEKKGENELLPNTPLPNSHENRSAKTNPYQATLQTWIDQERAHLVNSIN